MRQELSKKDQYLNQLFEFEDETLTRIKEQLIKDNKWGVNIGFHEVSLLRLLINSLNIKTILEVGTLYGFSTYAMALALPQEGSIVSLEKNTQNYEVTQKLINGSPMSQKIKLVHCDAEDQLIKSKEKFDLIFIDANKSAYMSYLKSSLNLLNPGGIIIGDNTFLFGHVYGEGTMRASGKAIEQVTQFNQHLLGDLGYDVSIIPTTEGMTLIKKKL